MSETKEELLKKLKAIETKEKEDIAMKEKKREEDRVKPRTLTFEGREIPVKFDKDFNPGNYTYDLVIDFIKNHKPHTLVVHNWDGSVDGVLMNQSILEHYLDKFAPIDKGRPGVTVCDPIGYAFFSMVYYDEEDCIWIYRKEEVTAW